MGIKVAISGKGGVGKTTLAALIARVLAIHKGMRVIAVDADPVPNLGASLGIPEEKLPAPISKMKQLIIERTGATPGTFGGYFKMNPKVDDIPEFYSTKSNEGIRLLIMGTVEKGGAGCVCPESVLLKNLVLHLFLERDEAIIMDMEAGIEHIGRATSRAVDVLLIVVDSGTRSHFAARKIASLAPDIGLKKLAVVGNKIKNTLEEERIKKEFYDLEILGFFPDDPRIKESDETSTIPYSNLIEAPDILFSIVEKLLLFADKKI